GAVVVVVRVADDLPGCAPDQQVAEPHGEAAEGDRDEPPGEPVASRRLVVGVPLVPCRRGSVLGASRVVGRRAAAGLRCLRGGGGHATPRGAATGVGTHAPRAVARRTGGRCGGRWTIGAMVVAATTRGRHGPAPAAGAVTLANVSAR